MTDIILKITGSAFKVPMDVALRVAGGPISFSLSTSEPISLRDIWDLFSEQLSMVIGTGLPDIPPGPWQKIMNVGIIPSLWITPDGNTGNTSSFLQLTLAEELRLGTHYNAGPFDITIEPDITILGLMIGYDGAGDGLTVKARIKTTVSSNNALHVTGSPAPEKSKEQLVNFPFPLPAQNSLSTFQLNYLGIGQRIGPSVQLPASGNPMEIIFNQLETQLVGSDPETILTELAKSFYQPDRDWFIAADMRLRELRLRVLFNDPAMYGLEVSIPMTSPPSFFSGLLFEILYQKLGPNLGVYYGALSLPYGMRRIPLEGFILILPGFSAWIYTNGDFRINVGWPVTPNNAIGISFDILTGWAGFYFAKLRSGDNPGALPSVNYNPILEFGIGVMVTAGISINAGPLSASLEVNLSASFQGLLAWNASGSSIANKPDHYWFAGSASISVVLQGCVDLAIIKASVLVSFSVSAGVAFECGYQTVIPIAASVSVSVSLKVVFFTIHLSFHTTVRHTFHIGSGQPASLNGPLAPGLSPLSTNQQDWQTLFIRAKSLAALQRSQLSDALRPLHDVREPPRFRAAPPPYLRWQANGQAQTELEVVFVLQPTVVWGTQQPPAINLIATLVMDCPSPGQSPQASPAAASGYEELIINLVKWLLTFAPANDSDRPLSVTLQQLADMLGSGGAQPGPTFGGREGFVNKLNAFFASHLRFTLRGLAAGDAPFDTAAMLPMFDVLRLQADGEVIDFSRFNLTPANYTDAVKIYFDNVGLIGPSVPDGNQTRRMQASDTPPDGPSMASYLFGDYFLMIARYTLSTLIDDARQYEKQQETSLRRWAKRATAAGLDAQNPLTAQDMQDLSWLTANPTQELSELLDKLAYWSIAGFGSRYLMSGLQLPDPSQVPPVVTPDNITSLPTASLYTLSGQQYAVSGSPQDALATLSFTPGQEVDWLSLGDGSPQNVTTQFTLPTMLPDNPDPLWVFDTTPASPDPLTPSTLQIQPLPGAIAAPLGYQLKNSLAWKSPEALRTLFIFPQPLLNRLLALAGGTLRLVPEASSYDEDTNDAPIDAFTSLQIRLSLTQVVTARTSTSTSPTSPNPVPTPPVYQLNGTDESTRELIYLALKNADFSHASLRLLYLPPGKSEWVSETLSPDVLLAKMNLSTLNQVAQVSQMHNMMRATLPIDSDTARLSDVQSFLQLIWELSVVRAPGYYLYYQTADGQGLPNELFADTAASNHSPDDPNQQTVDGTSAGTADFMIIVDFDAQPADTLTLAAYHNSLWITAQRDLAALNCRVYDSTGTPLYVWQSTLAPGNIGFTASWTPDVDTSPAAAIPVHHLYHLMQYRITDADPQWRGSVWSLPVGPTENGEVTSPTATWQLQQQVPLLPFSTLGTNPYALIGQSVNLAFRLCDIYGNPLSTGHSDSFTPLYSDPLISLGEWPGLQSTFFFMPDSSQSARLQVRLAFNPDIVDNAVSPGNETREQWRRMGDKYRRIYQQLTDTGTQYALTCSLLQEAIPGDLKKPLLTAAQQILTYIDAQTAGSPAYHSPDGEMQWPLAFVIPFTLLAQQVHDIVAIGVSARAWRDPIRVDDDVAKKLPQVVEVNYPLLAQLSPTLSPLSQTVSPHNDDGNITPFARCFEQAFCNIDGQGGTLKLAQRAGTQISDSSDTAQDLWSVRFAKNLGFAVQFANDPLYFALRPLNIMPRNGVVDGIQYNNVDMDAWAKSFFNAFDTVMSPKMGVAIAKLDAARYNQLMQCKQQLAKAVPTGLVPVLQKDVDSGAGDINAAQQRLQQALLESLSSAYTISTLVQLPATVDVNGIADDTSPQKSPQLYGILQQPSLGSPLPAGNSSNLYQFTPVTLDLASGTQWATSLLTVAKPGNQSCITLPLEYQVSYLQHDFVVDEAQQGYVPSAWLKFVLPDTATLTMPITARTSPDSMVAIPIPLSVEPPLPKLISQQGLGVTMNSPATSPGSLADEIAQALQWCYQVQLSLYLQDQDSFYFDVERNVLSNQPQLLNNHQQIALLLDALFAALARFTEAWPSLAPTMDSLLQQAYGTDAADADAVLEKFCALTSGIAASWPENWNPPMSLMSNVSEIDHFCLSFSGKTLQLRGRTNNGGQNPSIWPMLQLAGNIQWTPDRSIAIQQGGWWQIDCPLKQSPDFSTTVLRWEPLAILVYQSAQFSSWTVRNDELVSGEQTNPLFIYQTDTQRFPDAMIPLIERDSLPEVHVGAISLNVLQQIMQQILTPLTKVGSLGINPVINLQVNYAWSLLPGSNLLVESPVLMLNALEMDNASPQTLAEQVAEEIWQWYQHAEFKATTQSRMTFALTLFGSVDGQQLPLVQINNIPVIFD
ncbi:hypothetical protein AAFL31_02110 [Klebsiella huaxiensis]|uniref:hypothetical protein n=1 Tax=Klebsiella huaxiensis TaxID=2153354 RepID=UPI0031614625